MLFTMASTWDTFNNEGYHHVNGRNFQVSHYVYIPQTIKMILTNIIENYITGRW